MRKIPNRKRPDRMRLGRKLAHIMPLPCTVINFCDQCDCNLLGYIVGNVFWGNDTQFMACIK